MKLPPDAKGKRRQIVKRLAKNIAQLVGLWLLLGALLTAAALVIVPADPKDVDAAIHRT